MVNPVSGTSSSGTITSPYSGLMRVNGMASGMDIDSMVSSMMKAASVPLDQMKQNQQLLEWKRDDYRTMYTSLNDFDQSIFSGVSMQSTFNKKTVTSSDDSKVSATAVNAIGNMSAQIGVTQLATAASWKGSANYQNIPTGSDTTLTFTVTDPGNTVGNTTTDRTVTISISAADTIDNIITKFNSSNLGVTMFKETDASGNETGKLVMTNNKTGTGGQIKLDPNALTFMTNKLGFSDANGDSVLDVDTAKPANDAIITFNGYSMTKKSNNFTLNGINYNIKNTTGGTPVNVSTATDVDSIYNSIKDFVDKYNAMIKTVNDKISEKRNRDYKPLTDSQRSAMTDTQITQWEDKAKSGMLANDTILSSGLDKMRQDLYSPVTGTDITDGYSQLSQIGITTSLDYTENGKLIIDETTLRQKIQDNPQAIYQLFNNGVRSSDTSGKYSYETEGLAGRLRDTLSGMDNQIVSSAGKTSYFNNQYEIGKQLTDISTQITDFQKKLTDMETRYYNQFTAMEQAMQTANQQSTYVSSMFSSGG